MTHRQETGMAVITAVVLLLLILLSSCSTKKTITEYVTVHDTLVVHHSDTLKIIKETRDTVVDWKYITLHDTLRHEKERVIVVNEKGDTLSQREVEKLWQKIHELESARHDESHSDSSSYLKAQNDSLQKVLNIEKAKEKTVIKRYSIPLWLIAILTVIFVGLYIYVLTYYRKKYNNN